MNPEEMWDQLVASGVSPDEATRRVAAKFGPPPTPRPKIPGVVAESTSVRPDFQASQIKARTEPAQHGTGFLRSIGQGATFGFGDELAAGARAAFTDETYPEALQDERDQLEAYRAAHPGTALIGEIGGGVITGGGIGAGLRATKAGISALRTVNNVGQGSRAVRAAKIAAAGAGVGGLTGAGTATEGARLRGATTGAAFGAGAGLGFAGAGKVAGALIGPAKPGTVKGRVVKAIGGQTVDDAAKGDVLKQLQRGRVTLDELESRGTSALPDEMLLDPTIGGTAMTARASGAAATPSTGASHLADQLTARRDRIPGAVVERTRQTLGRTRENQVTAAQRLRGEQLANAKPLYDEAFEGAVIDDPETLVMFQDPAFEAAYKVARRLAKRDGIDLPESLVADGPFGPEQVPIPLRAFQYMKDSLGDVIERGADGVSAVGRNEARQLTRLLQQALARIDEQHPKFREARLQFATDAERREAQELGRKMLTTPRDEFEVAASALGPEARQELEGGLLAALEDEVGARGGVSQRLMTGLTGDKLSASLGPERAQQVMRDLQRFRTMQQTTNDVIGNSKTAQRLLQAQEATGPEMADAVLTAGMTGNPLTSVAHSGFRNWLRQRRQGLTAAQVDALAPYLTRMGPEQIASLAQELRAYQAAQGVRLTPAQVARQVAARLAASSQTQP